MLYNMIFWWYNSVMIKNLSLVQFKNSDFYFLYVERLADKGMTNRPWHDHSFYEIMFVAEGESEYVIENRRFLLKGGDALLVKPYLRHFEHNRIAAPSSLYCLGFSADKISNGALAEKVFGNAEHITVGTDSPFALLMRALKNKLSFSKSNALPFVESLTEAIIMTLEDGTAIKAPEAKVKNSAVHKAIEYINANISSIKTLDDIAQPLFFSKNYVRAAFKKELGIGIMEYVRNKKLLLAHERIRNGEKPSDIYIECGFGTYSSFYRAYLAYFGHSPKFRHT